MRRESFTPWWNVVEASRNATPTSSGTTLTAALMGDTYRIGTKLCVRRTAAEWVEHEITLDSDSTIAAWIPKRDGSAVALVTNLQHREDALPDSVSMAIT